MSAHGMQHRLTFGDSGQVGNISTGNSVCEGAKVTYVAPYYLNAPWHIV